MDYFLCCEKEMQLVNSKKSRMTAPALPNNALPFEPERTLGVIDLWAMRNNQLL